MHWFALAAVYTGLLVISSVFINHVFLLIALLRHYSVNALVMTVYTFVFCPIFVASIGFPISLGIASITKRSARKTQYISLIPVVLIMATLQFCWFPAERIDRSKSEELPSLEELLKEREPTTKPEGAHWTSTDSNDTG